MDSFLSRKEFKILKYTSGKSSPIGNISLSTQQLFVARWMNLGEKKRCFLKHAPGTGKTMSGLYTARTNLELYKLLGKGKIIIVGFQRKTFFDEILTKAELGFFQPYEYIKLNELRNNSSEIGQENYKKYVSYLRKKLNCIIFFGYQELYNLLFDKEETKINNDILELFEYSFIICDEIHNVYNSQETNIYGTALKYIFDFYEGKKNEPKVLLMSATPINNKPSEIVDLINLLIPKAKYNKNDFFSFDGTVEKLIPGALDKIKNICAGYFSFYINEDPKLMPKKIFLGNKGQIIKYTECLIPKKHQELISKVGKLRMEDHNLYDIYFELSNGELIYKTSDYSLIESETLKWREENGINYINETITGNIFYKNNLKNFSIKYFNMLEYLEKAKGKVLIYHEYVNGSGVKMLEQILSMNGYLTKNGVINNTTRCHECGEILTNHKNEHTFEPARFLVIHGEIDKKTNDNTLYLYNAANNIRGSKYKIIIGSELIREGVNFNCIQNIFIMHLLPHISALLQLIGRASRMLSHKDLPKEEQIVNIRIFAIEAEIDQYEKKLANYRVVQEIEKVINEEALDISLYYNEIKKSFANNNDIGILPYNNKVVENKVIKLDTYNVFYTEWEIEEIKKIIAALFIISPAWNYEDLLANVKSPPFRQFIDFSLVLEKNFKIALGDMIYGIEPTVIVKENIKYKIKSVYNEKTYYVIYPTIETNESFLGKKLEEFSGISSVNFLTWIQPSNILSKVTYNITNDLIDLTSNYSEMKHKFYLKYINSNILEIPLSTEIYTVEFHRRLIEESISYVFDMLTVRIDKSEYHEFYFKILHFYNKLDLIIYANMLPENYAILYKKYVTGEANTNSLLMSNIANTSSISSFEMTNINKLLTKKIKPVASNILPVGHFYGEQKSPKLYLPTGWITCSDFEQEEFEFKENDIIIGYYEKSENYLNYNFKLRSPVHKLEKHKDRREIEKGVICEIKNKKSLDIITKKLGISVGGTNTSICNSIKEYLLYMELKDRNKFRKGKVPIRTRWCYLQYEIQ